MKTLFLLLIKFTLFSEFKKEKIFKLKFKIEIV